MAKPIRITYTGTGAQAWVPLDHYQCPFEVSVDTEGGTPGNIEYTIDDLQDSSITPAVVGTVTGDTLTAPATGIRLNVTAAPVTFKVLQSGR